MGSLAIHAHPLLKNIFIVRNAIYLFVQVVDHLLSKTDFDSFYYKNNVLILFINEKNC